MPVARKFTEDQITDICLRRAAGDTVTELAKDLGVENATISKILCGHSYRDVPRPAPELLGEQLRGRKPPEKQRRLTAAIVRAARTGYAEGMTLQQLADEHNVGANTLRSAIRGISWSTIIHPPPIPYEPGPPSFGPELLETLRQEYANGASYGGMARRYNKTYAAIWRALHPPRDDAEQ